MTGTLTGDHLTTLRFMDAAGVEVIPTPFPGAADQVAALLGGHIDAIVGNVGDVAKDPEKFRVLAVATEERHPWLPDAPTFKEQGIDLVASIERGLALPKGTSREVFDKLYKALEEITSLPEYKEGMEKAGLPGAFLHGDEWAELIASQQEEAERVLKQFDLIK
jgi:tripartite-type tricarboxylate transporter receptor subunit TctC